MSTVPVGYEVFHSIRRKGVTVLCFFLASAMAMGITVYIDSYSVHEWDELTDIEPLALIVRNWRTGTIDIDEIRSVSGVERAALYRRTHGQINALGDDRHWYGGLVSPSEDYYDAFPSVYTFHDGRSPLTSNEIAVDREHAALLGVTIGSQVNVTLGHDYPEVYRVLDVVGTFTTIEMVVRDYWWEYEYDFGFGIVDESLQPFDEGDIEAHVEIDRTPLTPFDAAGSLRYLNSIDESIHSLDPRYNPPTSYDTIYSVENYLSSAVSSFQMWQTNTRMSQLLRSLGVALLVALVMFLAVRYNINERRYETSMLLSRGASKFMINKSVFREVLVLSLAGTVVGLGTGLLFSRVAIAATNFFEFQPTRIWEEPFLISFDSILLSIALGVFLPLGSLFAYWIMSSVSKPVQEKRGRLSKVVRGLSIIRWDVLVVAMTILLLIVLINGGIEVTQFFILSIALRAVPLVLFLGIASLTMKAMRRGAYWVSKGFSRIVGKVPAAIGIRRIGKGASSAAPATMVMVLALSLAWTSAVMGASIPPTKVNHARFAFGADVKFHLAMGAMNNWSDFESNVSLNELVTESTRVSVTSLRLSAGHSDDAQFVGMNASDYKYVGYDYQGIPLENSFLNEPLDRLKTTPSGAIVTEDIALEYELSEGSSLRAFYSTENGTVVFSFTIISIVKALSNCLYLETDPEGYWGWWYRQFVGSRVLWVNNEYLQSQFNLTTEATNIICARTIPNANATEVVTDVLGKGGEFIITNNGWASVTQEVEEFQSDVSFMLDRAIDTMLVVVLVINVFGSFTVYAVEGVRARRREIALLRSMGAGKRDIIKAQSAEMLVIAIIGFGVLLIFSPLSIAINLLTSSVSVYIFPVQIFPVVPWEMVLTILLFFVVSIVLYSVAIAVLSARVRLAESLNAAWAESAPYGGDQ